MEKVRIGIIGVGNMGSAHAACISRGDVPGLELAALCDIAEPRRQVCRERFPETAVFERYEDLLEQPDLEAVLIAVPHPLHTTVALAALEKGKHVLLEKPVDVSVSRARVLNEAAEKSGLVFGIMFNQRTNALFRRAREIVRSGELGRLKRSVWIITNWYRSQRYYDSGSWRATWSGEGGGVLLNQCPHQLDLWQWIVGMPSEVTAFCDVAKYHDIEVEDDVTILTRYPGGATGAFITTTGEYPGTNRLEITGTLGKLVLEEGKLKWWRLLEDEAQIRFSADVNSPAIPMEYQELLPEYPEAAHAGILRDFTGAVLNGTPLLAPGCEGIRELTVSNAAYLSAWQGSIPVKIPFDEAAFDAELARRAAASQQKEREPSRDWSGTYPRRWQINW